jgi:hypothetical protein
MTKANGTRDEAISEPRRASRLIVSVVALGMAAVAILVGGGRPVSASGATVYPEHTYYVNCTGRLLDTGLVGPFLSILPTSLKPWPGIDQFVIDPSGAVQPFYSGEYVYYRTFVQWYQAGAWHFLYAGQAHWDQGLLTATSLDDGTFQYRASAGFPSGALQAWVGTDSHGVGIWTNIGGSGYSLQDLASIYPQAHFGESWVRLDGPAGTHYWLGVQTVWGQVLTSNTGYGMVGLPAEHSEYLTC